MKNLIVTMLILVGVMVGVNHAQPTVKFKTMNETQIDANTVRYDIYIENMSASSAISYLFCQAYTNYLTPVLNGGTGSWSIVPGSSELPAPHPTLFLLSTATAGRVGLYYSAAPQFANEVTIPASGSVRLATIELSTSASSFAIMPMGKTWRAYSGANPRTKYFYVNAGVAVELLVSGNYQYSIGDEPTLPVELSSLTVKSQQREVVLSWETKSEVNSSKFMVERASSSTTPIWINVGEVSASGNSNSAKSYTYTDRKLQSGKYIYRLKMVDADGSYRYSNEVETEVSLPKEYAISQNYPNPFNPTTRVDYQLPFDSKVTLDLYGITGEKVGTVLNSEVAAGYYTVEINASALNLASGVYVYRINATGQNNQNFTQVKKLMLTK